jgi:hypothetical protein
MNRWYSIRRMRGAVILIVVGVLALLNQWHILSWGHSWPLFLIVWGLLILAERGAWIAEVRERQAAQNLGTTTSQATGQPVSAPHWDAPSSNVVERPFIQTQPPEPEDSGREER